MWTTCFEKSKLLDYFINISKSRHREIGEKLEKGGTWSLYQWGIFEWGIETFNGGLIPWMTSCSWIAWMTSCLSMLDEIASSKTVHNSKEGDQQKRSKTLHEVKSVKNISKNQSLIFINCKTVHLINNRFGSLPLTEKLPESVESSKIISGEFAFRKDSHLTKFEQRPQIFVKLSFRELCG